MSEAKRRLSWNVAVACLWLGTLAALMLATKGDGDAYSYRVALARGLGWQCSAALVAALSVTSLRHWVREVRETSKLRRALGLGAAASAVIHAAMTVSSSPLTLAQQLADAHLRFGLGGLIILVLMAITSFPRVVRWLHLRSWKELHRLVYVAWLCAVLHALLSPYAWLRGVLGLTLVVIVVSLLRLPRLPRSQRRA